MKYFANINNADELRKAYRQHVINMHPDRGGNEEEFKAMQAEFETLKKQYQNGTRFEQYAHTETAEERARRQAEEAREREEWARWEAEERARREQEEREKAERIRKAQEVSRAAVRAWAAILERVSVDKTGQKARYYRFTDKKEAAAFVAATKRNIVRVINHYFPGLKVKVTISGEIWKEKFIIKWEDGPSEKQLRDTCKELAFFIPSVYCCADPGEDYGHHEERESTAPWREAYGQALGDVDDFSTERTLSDEGKQQAEELAASILSGWNNPTGGQIRVTLTEFCNLREALGFERLNDRRMYWTNYARNDRREDGQDVADMYRDSLRRVIYENATVTVSEKAKAERKAAQFAPRYGKALKSLLQLTGVGTKDDGRDVVFYVRETIDNRRKHYAVTIAEAVARLEQGESVYFGTAYTYDDPAKNWFSGKYQGGYKAQRKRAEKWAAAGLTLGHAGYNDPISYIYISGITQEAAAAIRADLQDVEKQREEWERKQSDTQTADTMNDTTTATQTATEGTTANEPTDTKQDTREADTTDETAPAEGLELVELADGLAVIGNSHTTYKHRRDIKAHGCTWNKQAARWEAHTPEDCDTLRRWFALRDTQDTADTLEGGQDITDTTTDNEPEALRGATLQEMERHSDRTAAPAWLKPGQTFKRTTADGREVVAIVTKLILDGFAYITANGCAYTDHVTAFDAFDFDSVTPCDIDDNAPEFARMLRNFQRIRKDFEQYQQAHPYEPTTTDTDPTPDPSGEGDGQADTLESGREISPLLEAVADVLRIFADIMRQAKEWEGVTVPAATLLRWKQEATDGTKTAAARLCEVCACLASLTPESRRDFDALGGIFWSLSEQLKQGTDPATLQGATDYARAQLFDLIDRTQTRNQARAIREANEPQEGQREAA